MINKIDNITIDVISTRLKNVVSPLNIIKWLNNFQESELKYAIDIASNITIYTSYEIEEIIDKSLNKLFSRLQKNEVLIIHPIGNFGKSGSMISYFLQKTDYYKRNRSKIKLLAAINNINFDTNKVYNLILVDDFVGTGNSIAEYFNKSITPLRESFNTIDFVGIAGMLEGVKNINPLFNNIEIPTSNIFKKAFSSEASYFGYRNYREHREMCYKYGILLTKATKIREDKTKRYDDALGYENSQALVSFSHGSPNNSLPIIWANKKDWFPLIPRYFSDKISVSKEFRKSISYELSILKEFGGENLINEFFTLEVKKGKKTYSSVSKIDFSIYAIIKLSRSGHTENSICQKLGILTHDYENILAIGKQRQVFKSGNDLTLLGLELYQDAKKCIRNKKRNLEYESENPFEVRSLNYLPKQFNGRS